MKRLVFAVGVSVALATTQGCMCGAPGPNNDAGTGGGTGGGRTGGGGGTTGGGGGGATGGGSGGGVTGGGGGTTGGGNGGGTASAARPAKDIISGAGRMTGGNFIMNAQVGQGTPQAPATGGGRVIQGNTAIKR